MTARIAVHALDNAVVRRNDDLAGCICIRTGAANLEHRTSPGVASSEHGWIDWTSRFSRGQRRHGNLLLAATERTSLTGNGGSPRRAPHSDPDLDRTHLPPAPTATRLGRLTPSNTSPSWPQPRHSLPDLACHQNPGSDPNIRCSFASDSRKGNERAAHRHQQLLDDRKRPPHAERILARTWT